MTTARSEIGLAARAEVEVQGTSSARRLEGGFGSVPRPRARSVLRNRLRRSTDWSIHDRRNPRRPRPRHGRAVNHWAVLTRECESSMPENAGSGRNPHRCARCPDRQFPKQRISAPRGITLTHSRNWGSAPTRIASLCGEAVNSWGAGISVFRVWLPKCNPLHNRKQRI